MMIKINSLHIDRFKKIKNRHIIFGGQSAVISGQNGTGKTTVVDAIHWLLTGQNSDQKSKFSVLELNSSGEPITAQDACVKISLDVDGQTVDIWRETAQRWSRKRGDSESKMTGHTSKYYWNDQPVTKKVFDQNIESIGGVEQIRMLIDPRHFCANISPQRRRQILMEMIPTIEIEKPDILETMTPVQAKKSLLAEKKQINNRLAVLPERIDELKRTLPTEKVDNSEIEKQIKEIDLEISEQNKRLLVLADEKINDEIVKRLRSVTHRIIDMEKDFSEKRDEKLNEINSKIDHVNDAYQGIKSKMREIKYKLTKEEYELRTHTDNRDNLKAEWKKIKSETITPEKKCYACGQSIPETEIEKQIVEFEKNREEKLKKINDSGKKCADNIRCVQEAITELKKDYSCSSSELVDIGPILKKMCKERDDMYKEKPSNSAERLELIEERTELEEKISNHDMNKDLKRKSIEEYLAELYEEKKNLSGKIQADMSGKINSMIKERQAELKKYAVQFETVESKLIELETYSRKLSSAVEKSVNEKFKIVKWRLFEHQINGGIKEICEPMVDGVQYNQDLNTGAKINAGIECIKVLSSHYDCTMPIIVDNSESVTFFQITENQMIRMVAEKDVNELDIELIA